MDGIGEAGDVLLALLDDGEGNDGEIGTDDAAADRLAPALTGAAGAVARVALGEEEADTVGDNNTLLHRETLLVVATGDAEDITLPLIAERVAGNLSAHLVKSVGLRGIGGGFVVEHTRFLCHQVSYCRRNKWKSDTYS